MDDRHGSDGPSNRQSVGALRAYEQLVEALGSEIQQVNRRGATAFSAGEHAEASRLLERAAALGALCQDVEALGVRLRELMDEAGEEPMAARRPPAALGRAAAPRVHESPAPPPKVTPRRRTVAGRRTPQEAYRVPILRALVALGGSAEVADVLDHVYEAMKDFLSAYDMELVPSGQEERWRNAAKWCRNDLRKAGLLRGDSPRGVWEISAAGREWLHRQG